MKEGIPNYKICHWRPHTFTFTKKISS